MLQNIRPHNTLVPQEEVNFSQKKVSFSQDSLSSIIKNSMTKQGISLRHLSRVSGISSASLSKILNNKQSAGIRHIQLFARHLNIPIEYLLSSIGIDIEAGKDKDTIFILNTIEELLTSFGIQIHSLVEEIRKELNKYEHYARTEEGREIILQQFAPKLATVKGAGIVIDKLTSFYQRYCAEELEDMERAILGSALLYFTLSPDVIPDYAFPLGYLDDAIAVNLAAQRLGQIKITERISTPQ
ncbi:MAG: helix-turn-helix domain-containing protein [Peptococcaceae bacterium]|nr:helix-turn-helix domain-containing protein [Peptococcaceae bacterium]